MKGREEGKHRQWGVQSWVLGIGLDVQLADSQDNNTAPGPPILSLPTLAPSSPRLLRDRSSTVSVAGTGTALPLLLPGPATGGAPKMARPMAAMPSGASLLSARQAIYGRRWGQGGLALR